MLIGQSADPLVNADMRAFLEGRPEIERVYNLITLQMGDDIMVALKARMNHTAAPVGETINAVEVALKRRFPHVRFSFFEPDNVD
jgi:divalent metal cation (Fe/Co/Zn/Cd) transporter